MKKTKIRLQNRFDYAENWKRSNPVLAVGEYGEITDTEYYKIGDGRTPWNSLKTFRHGDQSDTVIITDVVNHAAISSHLLQYSEIVYDRGAHMFLGYEPTSAEYTNKPDRSGRHVGQNVSEGQLCILRQSYDTMLIGQYSPAEKDITLLNLSLAGVGSTYSAMDDITQIKDIDDAPTGKYKADVTVEINLGKTELTQSDVIIPANSTCLIETIDLDVNSKLFKSAEYQNIIVATKEAKDTLPTFVLSRFKEGVDGAWKITACDSVDMKNISDIKIVDTIDKETAEMIGKIVPSLKAVYDTVFIDSRGANGSQPEVQPQPEETPATMSMMRAMPMAAAEPQMEEVKLEPIGTIDILAQPKGEYMSYKDAKTFVFNLPKGAKKIYLTGDVNIAPDVISLCNFYDDTDLFVGAVKAETQEQSLSRYEVDIPSGAVRAYVCGKRDINPATPLDVFCLAEKQPETIQKTKEIVLQHTSTVPGFIKSDGTTASMSEESKSFVFDLPSKAIKLLLSGKNTFDSAGWSLCNMIGPSGKALTTFPQNVPPTDLKKEELIIPNGATQAYVSLKTGTDGPLDVACIIVEEETIVPPKPNPDPTPDPDIPIIPDLPTGNIITPQQAYDLLLTLINKVKEECNNGSNNGGGGDVSPNPTPVEDNHWRGKKWFAYGTSITSIAQGQYANPLAKLSGMYLTNKGIPGGSIGTGGFGHGEVKSAIMTIGDGKASADLISLECGANEGGTLGDPYDVTNDTFCGCLNQCIRYLQEKTNAQIFVMPSVSARDTGTPENGAPENYKDYYDRLAAIKRVCEINRVYYIDGNANLGWAKIKGGKYTQDNIHQTPLGGYNLAQQIWSQLKNIPLFYSVLP